MPHQTFHNLHMGIELEVENDQELAGDYLLSLGSSQEDFYLKSDGSIEDGFEIVSHPFTMEYWHKHILKCFCCNRKQCLESL